MVRSDGYLQFGCGSVVHYACSVLGLADWRARELMRLAVTLDELPRLRVAAENGEISWCKLREVIRVADSDDEERWLEICQRHPYDEVERLVGRARTGQRLDADTDADAAAMTELRLNLSPDAISIPIRACHSGPESRTLAARRLSP